VLRIGRLKNDKKQAMKNIPKKIYIQTGHKNPVIDFNHLSPGDITWSRDRINDIDIEYDLSSVKQGHEEIASIFTGNDEKCVSIDIGHSDIAAIEALHDYLVDAYGYSLNFSILKRAIELTSKMYKAIDDNY
jgi:hypothetical protein